jgi:hypothetical protein
MIEVTTPCDFVMASGHFTTSHLPHDFRKWTSEQTDKWLEENAWEPFEYYPSKDIWHNIEGLANELASSGASKHLCKKCLKEKEEA